MGGYIFNIQMQHKKFLQLRCSHHYDINFIATPCPNIRTIYNPQARALSATQALKRLLRLAQWLRQAFSQIAQTRRKASTEFP